MKCGKLEFPGGREGGGGGIKPRKRFNGGSIHEYFVFEHLIQIYQTEEMIPCAVGSKTPRQVFEIFL